MNSAHAATNAVEIISVRTAVVTDNCGSSGASSASSICMWSGFCPTNGTAVIFPICAMPRLASPSPTLACRRSAFSLGRLYMSA